MKSHERMLEITAEITSAFVSNNQVQEQQLPELLTSVYRAVHALSLPADLEVSGAMLRRTGADIARSITHDALISFEDGRPYKMLKPHLKTLGMTFEEYLAKWGLPPTYPSTAPAYSDVRATIANASKFWDRSGSGKI